MRKSIISYNVNEMRAESVYLSAISIYHPSDSIDQFQAFEMQ